MSSTELYKILMNGDVVFHARFGNSNRGSSLVWGNMGERYLGDGHYLSHCGFCRDPKYNEETFWNLIGQKKIPVEERIVLASTYDFVIVKKENLPRLIEAMRYYGTAYRDPGHIPQQADALRELLSEDILGVCWNQTSINCDVWEYQYEYDGYGDEKGDTGRPFNIYVDDHCGKKHWFLFGDDRIDNPPLDDLERHIIRKIR